MNETPDQWAERIKRQCSEALRASLQPREDIKLVLTASQYRELFKDKDRVSFEEVEEVRKKERK